MQTQNVMDLILEGKGESKHAQLWLGSVKAAKNFPYLQEKQIKYVLTIADSITIQYPPYLCITHQVRIQLNSERCSLSSIMRNIRFNLYFSKQISFQKQLWRMEILLCIAKLAYQDRLQLLLLFSWLQSNGAMKKLSPIQN